MAIMMLAVLPPIAVVDVILDASRAIAAEAGDCDEAASVPRRGQPSSGRSDKLMRVTTGSHARFSICGYARSKQ
jgi:hypothetical protein